MKKDAGIPIETRCKSKHCVFIFLELHFFNNAFALIKKSDSAENHNNSVTLSIW